jgi:hypothetical protein
MPVINLPTREGRTEAYRLRGPQSWNGAGERKFDRVVLAAAHVVADPLADVDPWLTPAIDWPATVAYRRYLWSLGLGVAEATDTAQRDAGLDWPNALIRRSAEAAREVPGAVAFPGVNTDQLAPSVAPTIDDMVGGQQSARSLMHLVETFKLADAAGLIRDPDLAVARLKDVMCTHRLTK